MKKLPLIPTLITVFFVILMLNLGFWQLRRAEQKIHLLELLSNDNITQISDKSQLIKLPKYANITLRGHFLTAPQLLLDNQVNNGKQGYHVFTPFMIDKLNTFIMVNRGWLSKASLSTTKLTLDTTSVTIGGKLNSTPQVGIQLGEIVLDKNKTQQIITYYDDEKISHFLHAALCKDLNCVVSAKILWLNKDYPNAFNRNWNPIVMLPSKHVGYAVQWFAMSFVLVLVFVYWLRKQNKLNEKFNA